MGEGGRRSHERRMVRNGTLLREGPEVGVVSIGPETAGTPEEVATHQL